MAENAELLRRLDRLQATLELAFAGELDRARERVRSDPVNAAILDLAADWTPTTELQKRVARKAGVTERAVRGRFPELVEKHALETGGTEGRPQYRCTGLL